MFFVLRLDGCVEYANAALRQYCGIAAGPIGTEHCTRFVDRRDLSALRRRLHAGRSSEFTERLRIRAADGDYREVNVQAAIVRTPQPAYWIGVFLDADDAGNSVLLSTDRRGLSLRTVMSGNDCVELLSLDERVWAMSMNGTQMPEMTDLSVGKWSDFWCDNDLASARSALDAARSGKVGRFEASVATGATTVSWWDVVITPILDANGKPESLLAISRDISHTKQLEAQLRFLAESGEVLGSSLRIDETLAGIARLAVPALVSWCMISWQEPTRVSSVRFAGKNQAVQEALDALPPSTWREQTIFLPAISADVLTRFPLRNEYFSRLQSLQSRSVAIIPIISRSRILGALSVGTTERVLTQDDVALFEELTRRIAMALENARLFDHQDRVARALQDAMLPTRFPSVRDVTLSTYYAPGRKEADVGGDWYDAFALSDGRLVLSVGDVCGSGLGAAVTMGHLRQAIRAIARTTDDPATILNVVDGQFQLDVPHALATAIVAIFDPLSHRLHYALAGHPPPLVRAASGEVTELNGTGLPLGIRGASEPPTQHFVLASGSVLVLYTDGLIEGSRDVIAGQALLRSAVAKLGSTELKSAAKVLYDAVLRDAPIDDDVAIITLGLCGSTASALALQSRPECS
jgi:serine phosphatase RsbU (regulator of sigma subunit)